MRISRSWAMPNKWTFQSKPISDLLRKYNVNGGWCDPFCGSSKLAEFRNDIAISGIDSLDWVETVPGELSGILIDPPYSTSQIAEHYKAAKGKATFEDCQNIYSRIYDKLIPKLKAGGLVITCGWHSNGAGKIRGCEMVEILLVQHGGARHDTIVTVERLREKQTEGGRDE